MEYTSADRVRTTLAKREEIGQNSAVFRLGETDTAWNPKGTKHFLTGPGRVKYEKKADGEIEAKVAPL